MNEDLKLHLSQKSPPELVAIITRIVRENPKLELFVDDRTSDIEKLIKQLRYGGEYPSDFVKRFKQVQSLALKTPAPLPYLLQLLDKILKILDTNEQWDQLDNVAGNLVKSISAQINTLGSAQQKAQFKVVKEKVGKYQDFLLDYLEG